MSTTDDTLTRLRAAIGRPEDDVDWLARARAAAAPVSRPVSALQERAKRRAVNDGFLPTDDPMLASRTRVLRRRTRAEAVEAALSLTAAAVISGLMWWVAAAPVWHWLVGR